MRFVHGIGAVLWRQATLSPPSPEVTERALRQAWGPAYEQKISMVTEAVDRFAGNAADAAYARALLDELGIGADPAFIRLADEFLAAVRRR